MHPLLSLIVIIASCSVVLGTNFTDCGSSARNIRSNLVGCEEEELCPFILGKNATFHVNFTASGDMEAAKLKIHGLLGNVAIPFPVTPREVCNSIYHLRCPMTAEHDYTLRIQMPVRPFYPRMRLRVKVELQSKMNSTDKILCTTFPIEIVSPVVTTPLPATASEVPQ